MRKIKGQRESYNVCVECECILYRIGMWLRLVKDVVDVIVNSILHG